MREAGLSFMSRVISVIGTSTASEEIYSMALTVGRLLAKAGITVACGGRGGVMEAVCKGVSEEDGISLGILPGDISEANPYVTIPLATGLGEARNVVVVNSGEVVISIGGAFGTLSEIGFALKAGKPLVALNTWNVADETGVKAPFHHVSTPEEAVKVALELLKELDER